MFGDATIEWAIINDELCHVSDYAHLKPKDRPKAICEECDTALIFKCGDEKAYHFAHEIANEECSGGEGRVHLDAKLHLEKTLKKTNHLKVIGRCRWCHSLGSEFIDIDYDEVKLEYLYDGRFKADIGLLKDGNFCCGIEVYVSHRCTNSKIFFHQTTAIPCVEIQAEYAFKWFENKNLFSTAIYGLPYSVCFICEARQQISQVVFPKSQIEEKENRNHSFEKTESSYKELSVVRKTTAWRSVFCKQNAEIVRKIIIDVVEIGQENSGSRYLRFYEGVSVPQTICQVSSPFTEEKKNLFNLKYREFISQLKLQGYAVDEKEWIKV